MQNMLEAKFSDEPHILCATYIVHLKVFILTYKIFVFFPLVTLHVVYAAVLILKIAFKKTKFSCSKIVSSVLS